MKLGIVQIDDEMFGNSWSIDLKTKTGGVHLNGRPTQFDGVHGIVKHDNELHLLSEDDGHFWTSVILSKEEINTLHKSLSKLSGNFTFRGNYKVSFDTHIVLDRTISKDMSLKITPRGSTAPLIEMMIKGVDISYDVNFLPSLIRVLDIETPIKERRC